MSNLTVVLSTTKNILVSDLPNEKMIKDIDVPLLCASMTIGMFGFGPQMERMEHHMAETCKGMAKVVSISKPKVFVGEDPSQEETALIDYTSELITPVEQNFFDQYDKKKMLFMEFQVFGNSNNPIFSLKGLWTVDYWHNLDICPANSFSFISPNSLKA